MRLFISAISIILLISCKNVETSQNGQADQKILPDKLERILNHHGDLSQWKKMASMSYELVKDAGNEFQRIDLYNRKEVIEASNYKTGYDGDKIWLASDTTYKSNPTFYHNLMFYFIAMPFVLADDGIIISESSPLEIGDMKYPGLKISYEDEVGISPEEYI